MQAMWSHQELGDDEPIIARISFQSQAHIDQFNPILSQNNSILKAFHHRHVFSGFLELNPAWKPIYSTFLEILQLIPQSWAKIAIPSFNR